jgi:hypothetical protein
MTLEGVLRHALYNRLDPKQSYIQETYLTHPWVITDVNDQCLNIFLPIKVLGTAKVK